MTTSVPDLVRATFSLSIVVDHSRFLDDGWWHQGQAPTICRTCSSPRGLEIYRKEYFTTMGEFRYWSLVCVDCRRAMTLDGFTGPVKRELRRWSDEQPKNGGAESTVSNSVLEVAPAPSERPSALSSVSELVRGRFGVAISPTHPRFAEMGWRYQGRSPHNCLACASKAGLEVFRKPHRSESGGFEFWCLVCLSCSTMMDLNAFDAAGKRDLREWSNQTPSDNTGSANGLSDLIDELNATDPFNKDNDSDDDLGESFAPDDVPPDHLHSVPDEVFLVRPPSASASKSAVPAVVLEAARAELRAQEGQVTIVEVGLASPVSDSEEHQFRISGPTKDISDLPATELFLATEEKSQNPIKITRVRIATPSEVVVVADFAEHYPKNLILFAKNDPTVVMRALVAFLESVDDPQLADIMVAGGPLTVSSPSSWEGLNPEQESALGSMVSHGVSLVWGPPGTGKTRVIGAAVSKLIAEGKSVALVSSTNVAVDQALLQVCDDVADLKPGDVLRLGHPSLPGVTDHPFLMADRAAQIIGEELTKELAELTGQLNIALGLRDGADIQQLEELIEGPGIEAVRAAMLHRDELASRDQNAVDLENAKGHQSDLEKSLSDEEHGFDVARKRVNAMEEHKVIAELERQLTLKRESLVTMGASIDTLNDQVASASKLSYLKRRKATRELEQLRESVSKEAENLNVSISQDEQRVADAESRGITALEFTEARAEEVSARARWVAAKASFDQLHATVSSIEKEIERIDSLPRLTDDEIRLLELVDQIGTLEDLQTRVNALLASKKERKVEAARLTARIEPIQKELSGLAEKLIASAPVIGTTLAQLFVHRSLASRSFDHIIVDEVSAALSPLVFGALAKAETGATLVGDFEQNGPISNIYKLKQAELDKISPDARNWLETHSFERFGIDSAGSAEMTDGCSVLTRQYRFGPLTMELANNIAYGGLLERGRAWEPADGDAPEITIVDTSSLREAASAASGQNGKGKWWAVGSAAALAVAKRHADVNVGIVTPYRDQMRMTKAWLGDQSVQNTLVGTAHAFQGQEFPVVLVDLVEDGGGQSWVAKADRKGSKWSLDGVRLFNVAVTRNAGRLYILANVGAISAARKGPLLEVGKMLRDDKISVLDIRELLGSSALAPKPDELSGNSEVSLLPAAAGGEMPNFEILTDETFYPAFEADLERSRSEVILYSPFVATNRMNQILPVLKAHSDRGVKIRIFTKSADELDRPELLDKLRDAGLTMKQIRGMHEKIVVIDHKVTYVGSLNVLSNNGRTRELMSRFEGSDFARQVLRSFEFRR